MCGRTGNYMTAAYVAKAAHCKESEWVRLDEYKPCRNAYPSRRLPIIVNKSSDVVEHAREKSWLGEPRKSAVSNELVGSPPLDCDSPLKECEIIPERCIVSSAWGIVPSYHKPEEKEDHFRMFNARADNLARVHSRLMSKGNQRRCVVVVQGFFEWKRTPDPTSKSKIRRTPYFVTCTNGKPMFIAGIVDVLHRQDGTKLISHAVITVDSSQQLSWLHSRMPVILPNEEAIAQWLSKDDSKAMKLLQPYNNLEWCQVTNKVNILQYQGSDCQKEFVPTPGLRAFFGKPTKSQGAAPPQANPSAVSGALVKPESSLTKDLVQQKSDTKSGVSKPVETKRGIGRVSGSNTEDVKQGLNGQSNEGQAVMAPKRAKIENGIDVKYEQSIICLDDDSDGDQSNLNHTALPLSLNSYTAGPSPSKDTFSSNNKGKVVARSSKQERGPIDRFFR